MRGDCSYDKYEHDYIVYPYDVLFVERKKREDTAPVKRVELHRNGMVAANGHIADLHFSFQLPHPVVPLSVIQLR